MTMRSCSTLIGLTLAVSIAGSSLLEPAMVTIAAAEPVYYQHGAVAADHPLASEAGVDILRRGGNVIDAAVATSLVLSVVRPESSGLGGGGFLIFWDAAQQQAYAWDYRERAPAAATETMYVDAAARGAKDASRHGPLAIAVPGEIPGLCEIHRRAGRMPWGDVVEPALRHATDGIAVDAVFAGATRSVREELARLPDPVAMPFRLGYLPMEGNWRPGDRFQSPQRPALQWLAEQGLEAWTDGPIGAALVEHSRAIGGLLTREDLRLQHPVVRTPLRSRWGDYELITMPPPSSGGIALVEILQILDAWSSLHGNKPWREWPEADRLHVLVEAMKHAFADRAEYLGDADFVEVPVAKLVSPEHARRLAARIKLDQTPAPETYGRFTLPDDGGTTHFCVVDAAGNAVVCTETINTTFGSLVVEPRTGIVLNNEMDDFTAIPGVANAFGLRQSPRNSIAPGKKPLSSMTPTIVLKEGRVVALAGASGGPRIITSTLQVLLRMLEFEEPAASAVAAARFHHQWQPAELLYEAGYAPFESQFTQRGHVTRPSGDLAATQAIRITPRGLEPASDPRKQGRPAGY